MIVPEQQHLLLGFNLLTSATRVKDSDSLKQTALIIKQAKTNFDCEVGGTINSYLIC